MCPLSLRNLTAIEAQLVVNERTFDSTNANLPVVFFYLFFFDKLLQLPQTEQAALVGFHNRLMHSKDILTLILEKSLCL